jgi:hypothetical protein
VLFETVVARVGADRYRAACETAWASAAGCGRCGGQRSWAGSPEDVPHEIQDAWWNAESPLAERLAMGLRVLREMPCYANTMALKSFHEQFGPHEKQALWDAYRAALEAEDDRRADPVSYSLWVDFFEDAATVEEAWREMTARRGASWRRRVERVLDVAGPVPWALKEALFAELVGEERWHPAIFAALRGSAFDAYGDAGPNAREWLARLRLPDDAPDLQALRAQLSPAAS